jgi:4-aminobutyrate aminotransferase-like enzyme
MFVDPAFTSDGILGPAHDWLRQAAAAVRAGGGLFVGDEVQAGFGRTGESLWSLQPSGVEPEIMTLGKPMGNGFPVAAVIARSDVVDSFIEETGYFSTFGGNTAACTAALAVLDVIEEEGLVEHAKSVGVYLDSSLRDVMSRHEVARSLRSFGLIAGLELAGPAGSEPSRLADHVANRMRGLGVLVGTTGPAGSVLKIRPPLVVEREHVDLLCERLDESLGCAESEL